MVRLRISEGAFAIREYFFVVGSILLGGSSYPSQERPVEVHFRHAGLASSHFMRRILAPG